MAAMINGTEKHFFKIKNPSSLQLVFEPKPRLAKLLQLIVLHLAIHDEGQRQSFETDLIAGFFNNTQLSGRLKDGKFNIGHIPHFLLSKLEQEIIQIVTLLLHFFAIQKPLFD
jgi:hypothetical protein